MGTPSRRVMVQRSLSTRVMRAVKLAEKSEVWIEDDELVWVLVEVVSQDNTFLTVRHKSSGVTMEIDMGFAETYIHNPKVVSDMTALHHIHEAGILHNLGQRAALANQRPYTFMGTILIALNPLRRLPDPSMDAYMNRPLNPDAPHPYAIAELAYHQMRLGAGKRDSNQSIIVSGESGAGKTETSKVILRFLTHRSVGGVTTLEQRVVESSPILESFGNAKTLRNDNSSRFGKFLKLQFTNGKYRLAGAFIETYLLEKSRVLTPGYGERNFHVLYELIAGARAAGLDRELKLGGPEAYRVLSASGCTTLEGVDDAAQFEEARRACDTIGMEKETQMQVWKVLASVLHMSNVTFEGVDDEQGEVAVVKNAAVLDLLGSLLGLEADVVNAMLRQREVTTMGETFNKRLGVQEAERTRDAIVKAVYEALFLWLVNAINQSLGKEEGNLPFIGVLDIFGFENFDTKNEFEQLLINFTNESLQDTFNKQVFENELRLYEQEGIEVTVSACPDNAECLKLLSGRPNGIIPSLDNICADPKPLDSRYLERLHKTHARHEHFPRTRPKDMRECFSVQHYAGSVKYTVEGWVEKNMDNIPQAFTTAVGSSKYKVVREMVKTPPSRASPMPTMRKAAMRARGRGGLMKATVAKSFLASMTELNTTLVGTTCNFIRCIKPNKSMECGVFENRYVVEQLQCLGILQTCEVLKVGMPTRVTYKELKDVLGDKAGDAENLFKDEPETSLIAAILWAFEIPSEMFRLGRTRVFFKAGQISTVQKILNETGPEKAPWILGRLKEALASRQEAKKAAGSAQAILKEAEDALYNAEEAACAILGPKSDSDEDESLVDKLPPLSSVSGVSDEDLSPLESIARKARSAGSTLPQIDAMVKAAREDNLGEYSEGAMDRVLVGSQEAMGLVNAVNAKVAELEDAISKVRDTDEAAALKKLGSMLRQIRSEAKVAKDLTEKTVEAAAKCQVEASQRLGAEAKNHALSLKSQAVILQQEAGVAAKASELQQSALTKAVDMADDTKSAGEKALAAFSSFKKLLERATSEEDEARVAKRAEMELADREAVKKAATEREEQDRREKEAAAQKREAEVEDTSIADGSRSIGTQGEDMLPGPLDPSPAPASRRASAITRKPSMSVREILKSKEARTPIASPSPERPLRKGLFVGDIAVSQVPAVRQNVFRRSATERFSETMESGRMEGHLMLQSKMMKRWTPRYVVLDNGFIRYYDKKSLVGTKKNKAMQLTPNSVASRTNQANFFGVRTGATEWIMLARSQSGMTRWIDGINAQIHALFIREHKISEDDYLNEGTSGQFFYQMVDDVKSQWIRAYPLLDSPRTGDGLFAGEVIEVTQIITNKQLAFARMADDRGWAALNGMEGGGQVVFTKVLGELIDDRGEYTVPLMVTQAVAMLFGPGEASQETGKNLMPGDRVRAVQRFTPAGGRMSFVKVKYGRGWLPVMERNGTVGVVPVKR